MRYFCNAPPQLGPVGVSTGGGGQVPVLLAIAYMSTLCLIGIYFINAYIVSVYFESERLRKAPKSNPLNSI
jgi:hypothetical protein